MRDWVLVRLAAAATVVHAYGRWASRTMMSPMSSRIRTWMCLVPGLFLGLQNGSAQAVANGGFETGTFVSAGSFAGGTYMAFGNPPTSWSAAGGTGANYKWVNSVAAHGGSKYSYSTSSGNVNAGSDSCFQANITGLTAGNCYTISVWAAEAGGSVNNPNRNPSFLTLEFQHDASAQESFEYGRFILPNNPAWSDTAVTGIPWAQYSYTFTATTRDAAHGMILWVSSNGTTLNGTTYTTYMVADDVTIAAADCSAITYDYGDLPVTGTTFNTDGANAPRHKLVPGVSLRLGSTIDGESNGQPTAFANGDDNNGGNDEDGERRGERETHRQVRVRAQRLERLLGAVRRRREAIGSQPHPGQERDQRQAMEHRAVGEIARLAEHDPADAMAQRRRVVGGARLGWLGRLWSGRRGRRTLGVCSQGEAPSTRRRTGRTARASRSGLIVPTPAR